jgi:hypothetical protein
MCGVLMGAKANFRLVRRWSDIRGRLEVSVVKAEQAIAMVLSGSAIGTANLLRNNYMPRPLSRRPWVQKTAECPHPLLAKSRSAVSRSLYLTRRS